MTLPKSYRVQDGCHNCKYVFCYQELEYNDEFYCKFDAPNRPKSGGLGDDYVLKNEHDDEECMRHLNDWGDWSDGREVDFGGICDEHEKESDD